MAEISKELRELSEKIQGAIEIDDSGNATIDKEFYVNNLPEGTTVEQIRAIKKFDTLITAAAADGFGRVAIEKMATNKDIDKSSFTLPTIDKDSIDFALSRQRTGINPATGEETVSYGRVVVSATAHSVANAGQLKLVKKELAELAMKKFASE